MRKLVLVMLILLGFSVMAAAQDTPAVELFGGYSFMRCDTDDEDVSCNLSGWNGAAAINGNRYVGAVVDFGGAYGDVDGSDLSIHTIMVGPRITFRTGRATPFGQILMGNARDSVEGVTTNRFAMSFGGGVDVNINDMIAIRPVQVEYLTIKVLGDYTDNMRYSAGVVFKLGSR
ncbi:MAG TPA: outer membrane beta-barrel protein [Acidobacteriota bacterium]|nr:outer membrane beta-barrel protein [Acidobacteriota bacterium]